MSAKRTYGDGCGVAHALDLVGERWALLVVRELLLGPKRFTDLRAGLPKASPNVLAQRLRELEDARVVTHRRLPPPAASQVYELTARGRELEPIVLALGSWGVRSPDLDPTADVGPDSAMLAVRTYATDLDGLTATIQVTFGETTFTVLATDGMLDIRRGPAAEPDVEIATDTRTFVTLLGGGLPLAEADAKVVGRTDALERLFHAVRIPATP